MKTVAVTGNAYTGKTYSATRLAEMHKRDGYMVVVVGFADAIKDIIRHAFGVNKSEAFKLSAGMDIAKENGYDLTEFAVRVLDVTSEYIHAHGIDDQIADRDKHIAALTNIFEQDVPMYRQLAQYIGTELGRKSIGEGVWVSVLDAKLRQLASLSSDVVVIVDDLRFENEYLFLRDIWNAEIYRTPPVSMETIAKRAGLSIKKIADIYAHASEIAVRNIIDKYDIYVVDLD